MSQLVEFQQRRKTLLANIAKALPLSPPRLTLSATAIIILIVLIVFLLFNSV